MKIARAEKNLKYLFKELKKFLEKPPGSAIIPNCTKKVSNAIEAEKRDKFITFMYDCYNESKDQNADSNYVKVKDFVPFVKFFLKDVSGEAITDIYMWQVGILEKIRKQLDTSASK